MTPPLSVTNYGSDRTLITVYGAQFILDCTLEALELAVWAARQERDQLKADPDEGFSKPMSPWGKEEV